MTTGDVLGAVHGDAQPAVVLGAAPLRIDTFVAVCAGAPVALDPVVAERMHRAAGDLEAMLERGVGIYGVTTGYGRAQDEPIAPAQRPAFQVATLRSHACGSGTPFPPSVARGAWLAKLVDVSTGLSGASPAIADGLVRLLNLGFAPIVPESGSLGASGDLIPAAHAALALIGEGEVTSSAGRRVSAASALATAGMTPLALGPRDGLTLVNGTSMTTALAAHACESATRYLALAARGAVASLEAFGGHVEAFDDAIVRARPQLGAFRALQLLKEGLSGRKPDSARPGALHDPYAWRCLPQVHGTAHDALDWVTRATEIELSSCTDNPILEGRDRVVSGGNFHAGPLGVPLDALALALREVGALSRQRIVHLRDTLAGSGAGGPGLTMVLTTVTAALFSAAGLAPATGRSLPIDDFEDHVSNATVAGRQALTTLDALWFALAGEVLATSVVLAATGRDPSARAARELAALVRELGIEARLDRPLHDDLASLSEALRLCA